MVCFMLPDENFLSKNVCLKGDAVRLFLSLYLLGQYSNARMLYKSHLSGLSDMCVGLDFNDIAISLLQAVAQSPFQDSYVLVRKQSKIEAINLHVCVNTDHD